MTEKTKKTLVISGACVICAALLTGIALRFAAGDSSAKKASVKTGTEQTEPVVNIDSTATTPKPSAEKLETTKSPTVEELRTNKTDNVEKADPSAGAVDTGTEQTIQPDPVKPSAAPQIPPPSAPAYQSGQDHTEEDVPQEERDLEEPPTYEETPVYEPPQPTPSLLIAAGALMFLVIGGLSMLSHYYTLSGIKSRTVGDGQHGTARWATDKEIQETYAHIPFDVEGWRSGKDRPDVQGLLGSTKKKGALTALVDSDDIHCLMIGASGVGKTAFFLYPNWEYACASGMSFLALDTKGDLARNYGTIAKKYYGYNVSVIDLRNPTRSDGNNLLTLVNRYMDIARKEPDNLAARAKAEKYAKILSKTIINPQGDDANYGQNAFFYDAAEGLLTSTVSLLAEFLPPERGQPECRHIVSVFMLVQDLLEPSNMKGKSLFQLLMSRLPSEHKARWFAGAALNSSEQAMASVMSTVLSRLNAFLDSELEQVLCFDSAIDAETFAAEKSSIFLILPEEDATKNFMAGLMIQNLSRELFAIADENGGKLKNRVVLFCDELGTMPPFEILPLFSAGRSRRLTLVPIIQSLAQLEKNYGKEGCEIIQDNCQDTIFGGFAPNSQTAEALSKSLGSRTVLSGSVTRGKNDPSESLQMMERALLTPDELKSIPKGSFIVMKTGRHPMRTKLRLFVDWGITFEEPYAVKEQVQRRVVYASRIDLERSIRRRYNKSSSEWDIHPSGKADESRAKAEDHAQMKT